jgi:hypothetical protein
MKYLIYLSLLANLALGIAYGSGKLKVYYLTDKSVVTVVNFRTQPIRAQVATPAPKLSDGSWMRNDRMASGLDKPATPVLSNGNWMRDAKTGLDMSRREK